MTNLNHQYAIRCVLTDRPPAGVAKDITDNAKAGERM
jgi:hypothetical protein